MLDSRYQEAKEEFLRFLPKTRLFTDYFHTLAYGSDASFYRLVPKIVLFADNGYEVEQIIKVAHRLQLPITFRAAGTSLSGQAISDSILVIISDEWRSYSISSDATTISLQPSLIASDVNGYLAPYSKKIGPDPASIDSAKIGGIAANNASGMCCGVSDNSYKTLQSIKIILADGTHIDTANEKSKEEFAKTHKDFLEQITTLKDAVKADAVLFEKIQRKFKIKNTCGYALNALVDFEDPFEIIAHLMIGSEGTLGFINEITYKTVVEHPYKASALMLFDTLQDACKSATILKTSQSEHTYAAELMDTAALRSVDKIKSDEEKTALLVETRASDQESLQNNIQQITTALSHIKDDIEFYDDEAIYKEFWKIRKGLFPTVGANRLIGTTVIIEDVAFKIDDLANGTQELQQLLQKYSYHEAIIFGHALEGNLHFVFTQDFSSQEEIARYEAFMSEVADLVATKYQGSLKAEHGTGRNMAPFVALEWGEDAFSLMQKIKQIFDPKGILNPDVIISKDKNIHLKNFKPMPQADAIVDKCIECGFCEATCPSKNLTLTPRQRIILTREIAATNDETLKKSYIYSGVETCATCSLCSLRCPVGIDTGKLTKSLRSRAIKSWQKSIASFASKNYPLITSMARFGLKINEQQPLFDYLPKSNSFGGKVTTHTSQEKIVYFSTCINRAFGVAKGDDDVRVLQEVIEKLCAKANIEIIYPREIDRLCCGMPFSSKGYNEEAQIKATELKEALMEATQSGRYPVLCDMSPCTKTMVENYGELFTIYEPIGFIDKYLSSRLSIEKIDEPIAIHITCSTKKMRLDALFIKIAQLLSDEVIVPQSVSCCGFAGDRGFVYPKLNQSALKNLKNELPDSVTLAFSTSKTCEIGLKKHSGRNYKSIFYLLDSCVKS
jgi:D-lactate dehydrogenase